MWTITTTQMQPQVQRFPTRLQDLCQPARPGLKMYVRHAAFIEGVELFAATTFSINKARNGWPVGIWNDF